MTLIAAQTTHGDTSHPDRAQPNDHPMCQVATVRLDLDACAVQSTPLWFAHVELGDQHQPADSVLALDGQTMEPDRCLDRQYQAVALDTYHDQ